MGIKGLGGEHMHHFKVVRYDDMNERSPVSVGNGFWTTVLFAVTGVLRP